MSLFCLCVVTAVMAQEGGEKNDVPDWVTREVDVWVENGIIYARGSARMSTQSMSLSASLTRARANLSNALADNLISGYSPVPADAKNISTFSVKGVSGTFASVTPVETFTADNGAFFILISCAGATIDSE